MKKYVLMTAMVFALTAPALSWAQTAPGGAGGPPPGGMGGGQHEEGDGQHFQERKTEILQRMNEHLAEVQKRIACVQAATNHEALRACMPERHEGHEGMQHGGEQH
ncbi:MAG: hypothetical protein WCD70_15585 [Alphaproteobacteria bacterium]